VTDSRTRLIQPTQKTARLISALSAGELKKRKSTERCILINKEANAK